MTEAEELSKKRDAILLKLLAEKSQQPDEEKLSPKEQLSFLKYAQVKRFFNQIAYNSVDRSINEKTRHACQEALAYYQGKKLIRVD